MPAMPKGVKEPLTINEVGGLAGDCQLFWPPQPEVQGIELPQSLTIRFTVVEGKTWELCSTRPPSSNRLIISCFMK